MAETLPKNSTTVRSLFEVTRQAAPRLAMQAASLLAPGLTARYAETLFLKPTRRGPSADEARELAKAQSFHIDAGGVPLTAWSWGDGPTVILMHGWSGRAAQMLPFVQPLLDAGFSVVAFDAPGHGLSGGHESSMVHFARALHAAVGRVWPVHAVIGHSLGGTAGALALADQLAIKKLVTIGSPITPEDFAAEFTRQTGISPDVATRMRARIEVRLGKSWNDLPLLPHAPQRTEPLLVVHDRDDREVPFSHGADLARAWPGARLLETRGLGHRRILRNSAVIAETVSFLLQK